MKIIEEAIVLVGGKGTRLRSVVSDIPKPLAQVAEKPFLCRLLDRLVADGMQHIVLASGYMADKIQAAIGDEWHGIRVTHVIEDLPLGTGGAMKNAASALQSNTGAHVFNGDTWLEYSPFALRETVINHGAAIGMALAQVDDVGRYGAVRLQDEKVIGFEEKGGQGAGHINAGCYFISAAALAAMQAEAPFSFEEKILRPACLAGQVVALTQTRGFIDIGVPEDYHRAQELFA
ncbi:dehydrogenase [Lysobacteraceae bacterium NML75-0749]|nr:dehydrogenase [Xanthomonadaceae bacterium NML75-0749]PJK04882.1 dehydrogenase [Xanthomonadaceae bacterium NML91-0268]PJK07082.1 dehydrogenase [Xanthomonadaceae bacterium NML71-0210]